MSGSHSFTLIEIMAEAKDFLIKYQKEFLDDSVRSKSYDSAKGDVLSRIGKIIQYLSEQRESFDLYFGVDLETNDWFVVHHKVEVSDAGKAAIYEEKAKSSFSPEIAFSHNAGLPKMGRQYYCHIDQAAEALFNCYSEARTLMLAIKEYQLKVLQKTHSTEPHLVDREQKNINFIKLKFKENKLQQFSINESNTHPVIDLNDYRLSLLDKQSDTAILPAKLAMSEFKVEGPLLRVADLVTGKERKLSPEDFRCWEAEVIRDWAFKMQELCEAKTKEILAQTELEFPSPKKIDLSGDFKIRIYQAFHAMLERCKQNNIKTIGIKNFRKEISREKGDEIKKLRAIIKSANESYMRAPPFGKRSPETETLYQTLSQIRSDETWLQQNIDMILTILNNYGLKPTKKKEKMPMVSEQLASKFDIETKETLATPQQKQDLFNAIKDAVLRNKNLTEAIKKFDNIIFTVNDKKGEYSDAKLKALLQLAKIAGDRKVLKLFKPLSRAEATKSLYASFSNIDFERLTSSQVQALIKQLNSYNLAKAKKSRPSPKP